MVVARLSASIRWLQSFDFFGPDMDNEPLRLEEPLELADTAEQMAVRRILDAEGNRAREALRVIEEAAAGGAQIFQLREKGLSDSELLHRARRVRRATTRAGALFIMNDRPDIACIAGADGVHLGQDDLPAKEARRIIGPEMLIGVSTHSMEQIRQAVLSGASYIG